MTLTLARLNALPVAEAAEQLRACCGSSRWVEAMVARRPFASVDQLLAAADDAWRATGPKDWDEAFAHHPRIGEHQTAAPGKRNRRGMVGPGTGCRRRCRGGRPSRTGRGERGV